MEPPPRWSSVPGSRTHASSRIRARSPATVSHVGHWLRATDLHAATGSVQLDSEDVSRCDLVMLRSLPTLLLKARGIAMEWVLFCKVCGASRVNEGQCSNGLCLPCHFDYCNLDQGHTIDLETARAMHAKRVRDHFRSSKPASAN